MTKRGKSVTVESGARVREQERNLSARGVVGGGVLGARQGRREAKSNKVSDRYRISIFGVGREYGREQESTDVREGE